MYPGLGSRNLKMSKPDYFRRPPPQQNSPSLIKPPPKTSRAAHWRHWRFGNETRNRRPQCHCSSLLNTLRRMDGRRTGRKSAIIAVWYFDNLSTIDERTNERVEKRRRRETVIQGDTGGLALLLLTCIFEFRHAT